MKLTLQELKNERDKIIRQVQEQRAAGLFTPGSSYAHAVVLDGLMRQIRREERREKIAILERSLSPQSYSDSSRRRRLAQIAEQL
jgi:uncharacterized coiled-coil DUF342 family protein